MNEFISMCSAPVNVERAFFDVAFSVQQRTHVQKDTDPVTQNPVAMRFPVEEFGSPALGQRYELQKKD